MAARLWLLAAEGERTTFGVSPRYRRNVRGREGAREGNAGGGEDS